MPGWADAAIFQFVKFKTLYGNWHKIRNISENKASNPKENGPKCRITSLLKSNIKKCVILFVEIIKR